MRPDRQRGPQAASAVLHAAVLAWLALAPRLPSTEPRETGPRVLYFETRPAAPLVKAPRALAPRPPIRWQPPPSSASVPRLPAPQLPAAPAPPVPRTTPPTIVAEAPALPSAAPRMPVTSSFSEASSAAAPAPRIITRAAGFAAASALGGDAPRAATTQTAGFDVPAVPAPATPHRAAGARDAGFGSAPAAVPGAQTRATPMRNAGFAAEPVAAAASTRARRVASAGGFESQAAAPVLIASREPSAAAGFAAAVAAAPKAAPPPAAAPLSRALEILEKPRPAYTEEARRLQVEGEVVLEAEFPAAGPVRVLRVIRGLGHGLDEAALQAARAIRFRPAERNGVPSATTAQVRIAFQLAF